MSSREPAWPLQCALYDTFMQLTQMEEQRLLAAIGYQRTVDVLIEQELGSEEVAGLLRRTSMIVAVEDYADSVTVVADDARFDFWKRELKPRLVEPSAVRFRIEDFPDEHCYSAFIVKIGPTGERLIWCRMHH